MVNNSIASGTKLTTSDSITSGQIPLTKKENWNDWLKIKLYTLHAYMLLRYNDYNNYKNYFLEYNIFSKYRKNITSTKQNMQNIQEMEENIIKNMTETWF